MFALATTLWKRPGVDHFVDTPGKCYSGLPRYMHANRQCHPCDFSDLAEKRFSDFRLRTRHVKSEHDVEMFDIGSHSQGKLSRVSDSCFWRLSHEQRRSPRLSLAAGQTFFQLNRKPGLQRFQSRLGHVDELQSNTSRLVIPANFAVDSRRAICVRQP